MEAVISYLQVIQILLVAAKSEIVKAETKIVGTIAVSTL